MNIKTLPSPAELAKQIMQEYHGKDKSLIRNLCQILVRCQVWSYEPRLRDIRPTDILREINSNTHRCISAECKKLIQRILHRYTITIHLELE